METSEIFSFFKKIKHFLIGLSFIFLGVPLTYNSLSEYHARAQLKDHGKLTQATPTAWHASEDRRTHEFSNFTLDLQYVTERGDLITADSIPAPSIIGQDVQLGHINTVRIRYLPETPSVARLAIDTSSHAIELSMGLLLLAAGIVITFLMIRRSKS